MPDAALWRRYLRFWRNDVDSDVDDELRFHLETRADALRARGLSPGDIERTIAEEFGDIDETRRRLRTIGHRMERRRERARWWHELRGDLAYAVRGLRLQPAFAAATLVTIALGIGATTAMLSLARAALVGSVPYPAPDRLVHLWERRIEDPAARDQVSYPDLLDWRDGSTAFSALEGYDETNVTLTGVDEPARLQGVRTTVGFFTALGIQPVAGRGFVAGDDDAGAPHVAVVSHEFWQRRLAGDSSLIDRAITLDGRRVTVVGVLPKDFLFELAGDAEVWLPIDDAAARTRSRSDRWLRVVGRLRNGATLERAAVELSTVMGRLGAQYPESNAGRTAYAVPLRDEVIGPTRPLLLALGGAVALVLLVACANVASLFLARALARTREVTVRVALGAGPARIVRQLLTESVLVAAAGGVAGAGLAWAGVTWLAAAAPPYVTSRMPFLRALTVDGGVLSIALLVALMLGVIFGLTPAVHAVRLSFSALGRRDGGGPAGGFGNRAWRALIALEIALTTVLLVGAGLMTRSVVELLAVDPGFRTERVGTMRFALAGDRYDAGSAQQRFFEALIERGRELPGGPVVGAVSNLPLVGGGSFPFRVEGEPEPAAAAREKAMLRSVAGDYFRAMGIPIVDGRAIGSRDDSAAPPALVLSTGLARHLFGSETAVGRRLRFYAFPETTWTVVGVVGDVRAASLDAPPPPIIYRSHLQAAENRMTVVVGTRGNAAGAPDIDALVVALQREVRELDPLLPAYQVGTMADQVASTPAVYLRRYFLMLLGGFACLATLLAAVGVYGVIAYAAARRMREMGVRAALGATPRSLLALVLRQGFALAAIGIVLGLATSGALARVLASLLYGVRPTDHLTYAVTAALLTAIALLASLVPAWRAARVNPTDLLRAE